MLITSKTDLAAMDSRKRANIVNALSGFKSPMLLGSGIKGDDNLAVFSNIFHIGSHPPLIGIFFRPQTNDVKRDSLTNILKHKFFTLNYIKKDQIFKAHQTSARYTQSEFQEVGIAPLYMEDFSAPFVADSPLSIALSFKEELHVKSNQTSIIIGEIEFIKSDEELLHEHSNIAVMGLDTYYEVNKLMSLSYAKPDKPLEVL